MSFPYSASTQVSEFVNAVAEQKENIILDQLSNLISEGLLVVEQGPGMLTQDLGSLKLRYSQKITLRLRDKEVYEEMKQERDEAVAALVFIKGALAEFEKKK